MRRRQGTGRAGVTLPEMLVAVSITVGMLLMLGMVFKTSSGAAGKATANNEIMQQLRAVTRQLERDFGGLQADMPLAVIFEEVLDPSNGQRYRCDRMAFFANGNFQTSDYGVTDAVHGNMAQIFYGQSEDALGEPNPDEPGERRILTRRCKIFAVDTSLFWFDPSLVTYPTLNHAESDYLPVEYWTKAMWKNLDIYSYSAQFFLTDYVSNLTSGYSLVRRPHLGEIANVYGGTGEDGVQRLYMLPDVTDFKVEVWFEGATEWFPNDREVLLIEPTAHTLPNRNTDVAYAFYWNAPEDGTLTDWVIDDVDWRSELDLAQMNTDVGLGWGSVWPRAIRFTFTLYDKNRRYYPEGRTFSYVVKVPARQ